MGDFADPDAVVEAVREFMEPCQPHGPQPAVDMPRYACCLLLPESGVGFVPERTQSIRSWAMFRQRMLRSRQTSIACMRSCAHLSPMKCNHDRQAVPGLAEQPAAAGTVVSASMPHCRFPLVQHDEPRYSVFADGEAQQTLVWVTFKHDRKQVVSIAGCVRHNCQLSRQVQHPGYH